MPDTAIRLVRRDVDQLTPTADAVPDGELLRRFVRDGDAAAFECLMHRHGPLVLGVCRRALGHSADAEDAFQATFLALLRNAAGIRSGVVVPCWLYRVAVRVCRKATGRRRPAVPVQPEDRVDEADPLADAAWREVQHVLDEELGRLPARWRDPLVLCLMQGLARDEAAARLRWSLGTLKRRLEEGRERLRAKLTRRGVGPVVLAVSALPTGGLTAAVPRELADKGLAAAQAFRSSGTMPPVLLKLCHGAAPGGKLLFKVLLAAVGVCGLATAGAFLPATGADPKAPPPEKRAVADAPKQPAEEGPADPLPKGAVMRLGSLDRRAVGAKIAVSADGKSIIGVRAGKYVRVWDIETGKLKRSWELPTPDAFFFALSPDGRWLVTEAHTRWSLELWDVSGGKRVREFPMTGARNVIGRARVAFSSDGKRLAALGGDDPHSVRVWELETGKELFAKQVQGSREGYLLAFTLDGKKLLASFTAWDGGMYCWEIATGNLGWQNNEFTLEAMVITPDGRLYAADYSGQHVLDAANGQVLRGVKGPEVEGTTAELLAPNGRTLVAAAHNHVVIWDLREGKEVRKLPVPDAQIALTPDGRGLVTAAGRLQRWELATGRALYLDAADGHVGEVQALCFCADGKRLLSVGAEGVVHVWDLASGKPVHSWRSAGEEPKTGSWPNAVRLLDAPGDGRRVVTAGFDERLVVWDGDGKEVRAIGLPKRDLNEGRRFVLHARLSADGGRLTALFGAFSHIAVAGPIPPPVMHKLATWDVATGKLLRTHPIDSTGRPSSALSPDGRWLISRGKLLDAASGTDVVKLEGVGVSGDEAPYAFSADGSLIIGGFSKSEVNGGSKYPDGVRVWETATGKAVAHLKTPSWVAQVGFDPSGRFAVTNDLDGIHFWDVRTSKQVATRPLPEKVRSAMTSGSYTGCFAFSPDGKRLATGLPDSTILIWEVNLPAPEKAEPPKPEELTALWNDLAGDDAAKSWRGVWRLGSTPDQALPLLRKHLKPVRLAPPETTAPLLADLDSDNFQRRRAATRKLEELGKGAEDALREALKGNVSPEKRQQVEALLKRLEDVAPLSAEGLRELRAVAALRLMGTDEAQRLLRDLAGGIDKARLTQEARAALAPLSE
jgi:RNA polymerase sigma factor (sigma-70 family)